MNNDKCKPISCDECNPELFRYTINRNEAILNPNMTVTVDCPPGWSCDTHQVVVNDHGGDKPVVPEINCYDPDAQCNNPGGNQTWNDICKMYPWTCKTIDDDLTNKAYKGLNPKLYGYNAEVTVNCTDLGFITGPAQTTYTMPAKTVIIAQKGLTKSELNALATDKAKTMAIQILTAKIASGDLPNCNPSAWQMKIAHGLGSALNNSGGTEEHHAIYTGVFETLTDFPDPGDTVWWNEAVIYKEFGPYPDGAKVRVRVHYRLPFAYGNSIVNAGGSNVQIGWGYINTPDPDPLMDLQPNQRFGQNWGSGLGPSGIEWTFTEDITLAADEKVRYSVRPLNMGGSDPGTVAPSLDTPTVDVLDEVALYDPIGAVYPPFSISVLPVPMNSYWFIHPTFDVGFQASPGTFNYTVPAFDIVGNGNSHIAAAYVVIFGYPHVEYERYKRIGCPPFPGSLVLDYHFDADTLNVSGTGVSTIHRTSNGYQRYDEINCGSGSYTPTFIPDTSTGGMSGGAVATTAGATFVFSATFDNPAVPPGQPGSSWTGGLNVQNWSADNY